MRDGEREEGREIKLKKRRGEGRIGRGIEKRKQGEGQVRKIR